MNKTITLLSALFFSLALAMPNMIRADDGKHMEEGSGKKMGQSSHGEYKDKKHSKEYKEGKGHMREGSGDKEMHDKKADHRKMEEGSGMKKKDGMTSTKKEGS